MGLSFRVGIITEMSDRLSGRAYDGTRGVQRSLDELKAQLMELRAEVAEIEIPEAPPGTIGGKYSTFVGNGSSVSFDIVHGLATQTVIVQVYETATGELVETDVDVVDATRVQLRFKLAPAASEYRVTVIG